MAKKFFFVCAGLFLLAGAYAMGARNAGAFGGGQVVVGSFDPDTDALGIDQGGQMWMLSHNGAHMGPITLPKPGTVVAATGANVGNATFDADVLYADGDAFHYDRTAWRYVGNVFVGSGPIPNAEQTLGGIKARYR